MLRFEGGDLRFGSGLVQAEPVAVRPEDRRLPLTEGGQLLPKALGEVVGHGKTVYLAAPLASILHNRPWRGL